MKTFITLTVIILLFAALVLVGLPAVIKRETEKLNSDVRDLTVKVQTFEKFKKDQERGWNVSGLKPNADPQKIVKAVNSLFATMGRLDATLEERILSVEEALKKQGDVNATALKNHTEILSVLNKELLQTRQQVFFNSVVTNITAHIMDAKLELASKNIGNVKADLQTISEKLQQARNMVDDKEKMPFDDLKAIVENIRSEVDESPTAANNMINLLRYGLDKAVGSL